MGKIFGQESKFTIFMNNLVDCFTASVLWIVFCLPVVTIGASTTALFATVYHVIKHDRGYVARRFFSEFRSNFKQSTLIWLVQLGLILVLSADLKIMTMMTEKGSGLYFLVYIFRILRICVMVWALYCTAYSSRFELHMRGVMHNALILTISNLPVSILMYVLFDIVWQVVIFVPALLLFLPAVIVLIFLFFFDKIAKRIMSDEDRQRIEEEEVEEKMPGR